MQNKRLRKRTFLVLAMFAFASAELTQNQANAQTNAPLTAPTTAVSIVLKPTEIGDFQTALTEIARQARVTIAVEGSPLHPVLTANAVPEADHAISGVPVDVALARVAALYGYDVQKNGRFYALRKRYSNPADTPTATFEEMTKSLEEVSNLLEPFSPKIKSNTAMISNIFAALTPAQIAMLPQQTLRVGDLPAEQRSMIDEVAAAAYVRGPYVSIQDLKYRMNHTLAATFQLSVQKGETFQSPVDRKTVLMRLKIFNGTVTSIPVELFPPTHGEQEQEVDEEDKAVAAVRQELEHPASPDQARTLTSVVAALPTASKTHPAYAFHMAEELRARPVEVFGAEAADSGEVFRALAAACDLAVQTDAKDKDDLTLIRRRVPTPQTMLDLPVAVRAALPACILRAESVPQPPPAKESVWKDVPAPPGSVTAETLPGMPEKTDQEKRFPSVSLQNKGMALQINASRRLRAALEIIQLRAASGPDAGKDVPATKLDQRTLSGLGAQFLTEYVGSLNEMPLAPPSYLADLDEDRLGGGVSMKGDKMRLALWLCVPDADGTTMTRKAGFLGINAPPELAKTLSAALGKDAPTP